MRRSIGSFFLLGLLLSGGCEEAEPLGGDGPSFLRADISGTVDLRYQGTGEFWMGGSREMGRPMTFGINSRPDAGSSEAVSIWRLQEGRPAAGVYSLRLPDYGKDSWESFAAVYHHVTDGRAESFVARSGEVRVTASTADRVEGTFSFEGVRYCSRAVQGSERPTGSCQPHLVDAGAPTIRITGSFVTEPAQYEATWR